MIGRRGGNRRLLLLAIGALALCVVCVWMADSWLKPRVKIDANQFISPWDMSYAPWRMGHPPATPEPLKHTDKVRHGGAVRVATLETR